MYAGLRLLSRRHITDDRQHLTAGIRQIAALEMAIRPRFGIEGELEHRRFAAQRGVEAIHGARPRGRLNEIEETHRLDAGLWNVDQSRGGAVAMLDGSPAVPHKSTARKPFKQPRVLRRAGPR